MNINDLSIYDEKFAAPLVKLYKDTGNVISSGYLGEKFNDAYFDGNGRFNYSTHKESDEAVIDSHGIILDESVLISQTVKSSSDTSYRLYSWDVNNECYTLLSFDREFALKRYYDVIKRFNVNLNGDDVSSLFKEMGLTFDNVIQILLNQKVNPIDRMFYEEQTEESFTK